MSYTSCLRCKRYIRYSYAIKKFVLARSEEYLFEHSAADCYGASHEADPRYLVEIDIPHRNRIP